jgi:hypothetical protein
MEEAAQQQQSDDHGEPINTIGTQAGSIGTQAVDYIQKLWRP